MEIRHIKHRDIDFVKWDKTIDNSIAPLIYAYSWYLENMANGQWDALVVGDYEAVFPMPWRKKFGLKYIYQPFFTQQLGVFAKQGITCTTKDFVEAIPKQFFLVNMQLNMHYGTLPNIKLRNNYQLNLDNQYAILKNNYVSDVSKNVRKIERQQIGYIWDIPFEIVVQLNRNAWGEKNPMITERHYKLLLNNCHLAHDMGALITLGAIKNEIWVGAVLFFKTPSYLFYLSGGATEEGKKCGIMNGLIDQIINKFANKKITLDFEGSEIKGVAYFYSKFGSELKPYMHYKKFNWL